jgi:hypothetical protein
MTGAPSGPGSCPTGRASKAVSPVPASIPSAEDIYDRLRELANAENGALSRIYSAAADEIEALRECSWHLAQGDLCEETQCADPKGDNCVCFNKLVIFYRGSLSSVADRNRRAASAIEARRAETGTGSVADESAASEAGDAQP